MIIMMDYKYLNDKMIFFYQPKWIIDKILLGLSFCGWNLQYYLQNKLKITK